MAMLPAAHWRGKKMKVAEETSFDAHVLCNRTRGGQGSQPSFVGIRAHNLVSGLITLCNPFVAGCGGYGDAARGALARQEDEGR